MTSPRGVFEKVGTDLRFTAEEAETLAFWKANKVFEQSLARTANGPRFVFFEGPPTANGMPHNGHVLTRVSKDVFPRYKTMQGFHVPRKAGWDTHGLPVEVEVEKELGIHGKAAIEAYGIEPFVRKCINSVFRYTDEWEKLSDGIGFWADMKNAYVTYHKSYVESVWWALSELHKKGLLYQGHKVVWWWAQGGTGLSAAEVGQGYKTVDDPSAYVGFPIVAPKDARLEGASLLVWTTTPWTLPSNMYAVVRASASYVVARVGERKLVLAKALLPAFAAKLKTEPEVLAELAGSELEGVNYEPPFDWYKQDASPMIWRVLSDDFVTMDSGTGVVHCAPSFGEDDHMAYRKQVAAHGDIEMLCAVQSNGEFKPGLPYAGRWVKDADKDILADLKSRGLLVHQEMYRHEYPFCWRADSDPLIQIARPAWYVRTSKFKGEMLESNAAVNWMPEHIREGRMGDFLTNNVDWALSRERFWGTPLNVWVNDVTGATHVPSSVAEILALNPKAFDHFTEARNADPTIPEDLMVHKPWVDQVSWTVPGEEGVYRRVPEVIDAWFDSGCMPFAQHGFPHANLDVFKASYPADFISEAIDQTRGWFYTLLAVSNLVFDDATCERYGLAATAPVPRPFKTCVVLGHVSDKEGKKESKSKGNYTPPDVILHEVALDFAVVADAATAELAGTVQIAREDLEGLDVQEGAEVELTGPAGKLRLKIKAAKKLRRRVAVLAVADRAKLGVELTSKPDVKVVDVPWLPETERVRVLDTNTPAPGADAFRWFFLASNPPWSNTRHSLGNVRALQKEILLKLRNVYSFFTIYANLDGFDPRAPMAAPKYSELDRWLKAELAGTVKGTTEKLDAFDAYGASQLLSDFVESLSNWYVRRARGRFWRPAGEDDADKAAAYLCLYDALVTVSKLFAPFTPFAADRMYANLVRGLDAAAPISVHLTSWPAVQTADLDAGLAARMRAVRALVSLGLQVRTQAKVKVRQPMATAYLIVADRKLREEVSAYTDLIAEELNVRDVKIVPEEETSKYVSYALKPNFRTLGARGLGKEAQALKAKFGALNSKQAADHLRLAYEGALKVDSIALSPEDLDVAFETMPEYAAAGDRTGVVVLDTRLDDELRRQGFVRELQSKVQAARKDAGMDFADRIRLYLDVSAEVTAMFTPDRERLMSEVLATELHQGTAPEGTWSTVVELEGHRVGLALSRLG